MRGLSASIVVSTLFPNFLVPAAMAGTTSRPSCTIAGLTDACAFFTKQKDRPEIRLKDGTAYANPAFVPRGAAASPSATPEGSGLDAHELEIARAENDLQRAWRAAKGPEPVSDVFRSAFTRRASYPAVARALGIKTEGPNESVVLPWPPAAEDAQPRAVTPAELTKYIARLPAATRQALAGAARRVQALNASFSDVPGDSGEPQGPAVVTDPRREARLTEIFKFARDSLLADLLPPGRDLKSLDEATRSEFERIASVRMQSADLAASSPDCAKAEPFAGYYPERHTFVICPNAAQLPDAFLAMMMGHEMSHATDGCELQFPLVEINRLKFTATSAASLPNDIAKYPGRLEAFNLLKELPAETTHATFELHKLADPDAYAYLEKAGFVRTVTAGVPSDRDPNRDIADCLKKLGFRGVETEEIERRAEAYVRRRVRSSLTPIDAERLRADTRRAVLAYPGCMGGDRGESRLSEAGADVHGVRVAARWMALHPPRDQAERLSVMGPSLREVCSPSALATRSKVSAAEIMDVTSPVQRADGHPDNFERLNNIILRHHAMQAVLRCEPAPGGPSCADLPATPGATPTPNATTKPLPEATR